MADFAGSIQDYTNGGTTPLNAVGYAETPGSNPFTIVLAPVNLQSTGITPGNNVIDIPMNGNPVIAGLSADPTQYKITALDGGVSAQVLAVSVVGSSLHLVTSEHTNGKSYQLQIPGCGLVSSLGQPYVGLFLFSYVGVGQGPTVVSASVVDARTIDVTFSENVNALDAVKPTNYAITPTLGVLSSVRLTDNTYRLTTTRQVQGVSYTVTVSNVHDLDGNNLI